MRDSVRREVLLHPPIHERQACKIWHEGMASDKLEELICLRDGSLLRRGDWGRWFTRLRLQRGTANVKGFGE